MQIKVKPQKIYKTPSYPDMERAALNPELLKKLPERWRHNKAVITALLALTSLALAGCSENTSVNGAEELKAAETATESSKFTSSASASSESNTVYGKVAPIFEHGIGTGSLGCSMVVPPVYLSEQEAMAIIKNEALKAGIDLDNVPENKYMVAMHSDLGKAVGLEASDNEKGIAVSFVSMEEAEVKNETILSTENGPAVVTSSVRQFNMKKRAQDAVDDWKNMDIPYFVGTFYEPSMNVEKANEIYKRINNDSEISSSEKYDKYVSELKTISEEELRAQVRDFIEWLRGQGVI